MNSVWNDEDSDGSQEENDNNVSQIAFTGSLIYNDYLAVRKTPEFFMIDLSGNSIAVDAKHYSAETYLDSGAEYEIDEEA